MKCNSCGSEWRTGNSALILSKCPICGAPLKKVEEKLNEITLDRALKQLIDKFGLTVLQDPERCIAIIMDIAPRLRNERKVLKASLDCGIGSYFINCPPEARKLNVNRAMKAIEFFNAESKKLVITSFVKALKWDEVNVDGLFETNGNSSVQPKQLPDNSTVEKQQDDKGKLNKQVINDEEEFESYIEKAENGDAESQYILATYYLNGINVKKNNSYAFKWFKEAAEQGHAKAQYELGNCYMNWIGTRKDVNTARYWYEQSVLNGNPDAKIKLNEIRFSSCSQKTWAENYDYEKQYSGMIQNPGYIPDFIVKNHNAETEAFFKPPKTQRRLNHCYQNGFSQLNYKPWQRISSTSTCKEDKAKNPQILTVTNPLALNVKVYKINVRIGDKIKNGDIIAELESYGMINEIMSPVDGIVTKIHVKKGEVINSGAIIIELNQI